MIGNAMNENRQALIIIHFGISIGSLGFSIREVFSLRTLRSSVFPFDSLGTLRASIGEGIDGVLNSFIILFFKINYTIDFKFILIIAPIFPFNYLLYLLKEHIPICILSFTT